MHPIISAYLRARHAELTCTELEVYYGRLFTIYEHELEWFLELQSLPVGLR